MIPGFCVLIVDSTHRDLNCWDFLRVPTSWTWTSIMNMIVGRVYVVCDKLLV